MTTSQSAQKTLLACAQKSQREITLLFLCVCKIKQRYVHNRYNYVSIDWQLFEELRNLSWKILNSLHYYNEFSNNCKGSKGCGTNGMKVSSLLLVCPYSTDNDY